MKYELIFPHPRIAKRVYWFGACTEDEQDWIYVAGELGGGIWAIERAGGVLDTVDYTDYRAFVGIERKILFGFNTRLELGYVFGRKLRFNTATPDFKPNDTVMIRGGIVY